MPIKVYIKPLHSCVQRRQNVEKWNQFIQLSSEWELIDEVTQADEIWVWTCAFREDVMQNSLDYLKAINYNFTGKKIIVGGCLPDISPQQVNAYQEICGNEGRNECIIVPWKKETEYFGDRLTAADRIFCEAALSDNIEAYKKEHPDESVTFCDQFIKAVISEGCNCECVYCSERRMFPPYRSFSPDTIKSYCEKVIRKTGVFNVVLVADSLGEYGCDLGGEVDLPVLIQSILDIDERVKVALNNLNPQYMIHFFDEIRGFIVKHRIRHINLPIQSANNKVLKDMKRKYTKQELQNIIDMFQEYNFSDYDTHILVGFDGETRDEFLETLDFIVGNKVRYVLASKYMDMMGDVTGRAIPPIAEDEKEERIQLAYKTCTDVGIIINCDDSNLNKDRMRRIVNQKSI